ncbi:MAG TPA: DUF3039 domain-containing protein [Actinotalea caeni]|uniref:DUF3039 domain-containing protein n=1 Tax=Actinotalea caeni TaxID=1348467 RepID=UPI0012E18E52|nr:DUF3039 domain-containing protein [Actinotalea caeni]HLV54767.1 DUF3039 domain-containing protein [Actinotalea caeni]
MSEPLPPTAPTAPDRQTAGSTGVLEREESRQEVSPGDAERYAHYVKKEKITAAAVTGGPVVALCGKVWTPTRDPSKYPVCPVCKEIYESMTGGGPSGGDGSEGGSGRSGFSGFFGRLGSRW